MPKPIASQPCSESAARIDQLCDQFEAQWRDGQRPRIEDYLTQVPEPVRAGLLRELLASEIELRVTNGEQPRRDDYQGRLPDDALAAAFPDSSAAGDNPTDHFSVTTDHVRPKQPARGSQCAPGQVIGRYRIERLLGSGGFADVYLAHDEKLHRQIAIKIPHAHLFQTPADQQRFLDEARIAAGLDHAHIVPVYDVGQTDDGRLYAVSKYISGSDLAARLSEQRPSLAEAVELVACLAEALHYAHKQGLVHRDIKPANILLNQKQKPYIADFGLAVREDQQRARSGEVSGTVAYMSPEQVRGEAHRLDGRTDIWSLGVMLYELLCGRRPFVGLTREEVFDEIKHREPKPPRMIDDSIPKQLEEACLKCLVKSVDRRWLTASDLAEALRDWLGRGGLREPNPAGGEAAALVPPHTPPPSHEPASQVRLGRYRLLFQLGADGHSAVWKAEDQGPGCRDKESEGGGGRGQGDKTVIVREWHRPTPAMVEAASTTRSKLFNILIGVDHPHIADILDIGLENDRLVVVTEFIAGKNLKALLHSQAFSPEDSARICSQLARALHYLHSKEMCHGELKPTQIIIDPSQRPHVLMSTQWLARSESVGTPLYLAPERLRGDAPVADGRCDIYSLGVILFELVTGGGNPFPGPRVPELLRQIATDEPTRPRSLNRHIPRDLEAICLKCLKKNPAQRYATASDLADDLDRYLRGEPVTARRRPAKDTVLSRRGSLLAIAAAIILIAGLAIGYRLDIWPGGRDWSRASGEAKSRLAAPQVAPLSTGTIDVRVWNPRDAQRRGLALTDPGALPLRPGDQVRIEAAVSRPAYLYILWIDAQGSVSPVYPWTGGDWTARPAAESPRTRLALPEAADEGWPMEEDSSGMETLVLLARETPLPKTFNWTDAVAELPRQPPDHRFALAWFNNGNLVTAADDPLRAPKFVAAQKIDDPLLRMQRQLADRFGQHFPLVQAVSFSTQVTPEPASQNAPQQQGTRDQ